MSADGDLLGTGIVFEVGEVRIRDRHGPGRRRSLADVEEIAAGVSGRAVAARRYFDAATPRIVR